jgi:hypothetical protein
MPINLHKPLKISILSFLIFILTIFNSLAQSPLIPFRKGNLWGYCDKSRQIIIPCQYENAFPFAEGRAMVQLHKKVGFIDETGKIIIPIQYDYLLDSHFFKNGLAKVRLGNQDENAVGFIDKNGKVVVPLAHYLAMDFENGLARVAVLSGSQLKYGFYDNAGKLRIPLEYAWASNLDKNGYIYTKDNPKASYYQEVIDSQGKIILKPQNYQLLGSFKNGLAVFGQINEYFDKNQQKTKIQQLGYLNELGNLVIAPKYLRASAFSEGFAVVKESEFSLFQLINSQGEAVDSKTYELLGSHVSEGLISVKQNGKWGYLDTLGKAVIACQYDQAGDFYQGLAVVELKQKYAYLKPNGELISKWYDLPAQNLGGFSEDLASVHQKNAQNQSKWGFIDRKGKEIIALKYDNISPFFQGLARVYRKIDERWLSGYIDKFGTEYWED